MILDFGRFLSFFWGRGGGGESRSERLSQKEGDKSFDEVIVERVGGGNRGEGSQVRRRDKETTDKTDRFGKYIGFCREAKLTIL